MKGFAMHTFSQPRLARSCIARAIFKHFTPVALAALASASSGVAIAQTGAQGQAPQNPYAAQSPWPHFHRNSYAQASSELRGPEATDPLEMQHIGLIAQGGTPTQMHISERYPDGSRTVWSTTLTSVIKARVHGPEFALVDTYRMDASFLSFNVHWNMQLGRGNKAFVPDPKNRAILRFGDANPHDSKSNIVLEKRFEIPASIPGAATVINMSHDGWIIFLTDKGWIGAVKQDFSVWRAFNLSGETGDTTVHNSFPIDEKGNIFVVSEKAMTSVRWDGESFLLTWRGLYNFRGEDCPPPSNKMREEALKTFRGEGCTGSGTTPTLMGRGSMDKLVLAVDSHAPNSLVAFWRDEVPANWVGLPGRDRRVAGVVSLPHSTWVGAGFTAENSPPAWGYDIAVAQWAGFDPGCTPLKGVQMLRWDPAQRALQLLWANPSVHFNNVMTISAGSSLLYGIGRGDDCKFTYRGLDIATGKEAFSLPLDRSGKFNDGGNSHALNDDRSIIFGVPNGIARLRPSGKH
jgi:hypothetical protein